METIQSSHLIAHLQVLTQDIGERLAGTPGEDQAARYIATQMEEAGALVSEETFPMCARVVEEEHLQIQLGGGWESFPASLFSNTPGTEGKAIEAPLVFFEAPTEYQRPDLSHLTGKAVVHFGCHIESRDAYRRLLDAEPACLLMVDIRYPGDQALADGMFPSYTNDIGAVPTMNVAYMDAWRWKREGATRARLQVSGGMQASESSNVIGELPGTDPNAGVIYVGAHHDTQAGNPGADDNGTGVVALLELARVLAPEQRRRTLRLISFGCEEQLSVGSAAYVRRHRREVEEKGRLMFNFDSFGSGLGWTLLTANGPEDLTAWLAAGFNQRDLYPKLCTDIVPYADHFPFVVAGVPGVWLYRPNCVAGRFYHHRADDVIDRVCGETMARHVQIAAEMLLELANADTLPFKPQIPSDQAAQVAQHWQDLFGGWSA